MQKVNKPLALPTIYSPISTIHIKGITLLRFIDGNRYRRYVVVDRDRTLTLIFKKPEYLELGACYRGRFQINPDFGNALEFFVIGKVELNCKPDFRLGFYGLILI